MQKEFRFRMNAKLLFLTSLLASINVNYLHAERHPFNSFTNIVTDPNLYPEYPGSKVLYISRAVSFTNVLSGLVITNNPKFSLIYYAGFPEWWGLQIPVGGLDGDGTNAIGWFVVNNEYFLGMKLGQTANLSEDNLDNGYWEGYVDANGNGVYGSYSDDPHELRVDWEPGEYINHFRLTNFQPFQTNGNTLSAGDLSGQYYSPSSISILALLVSRNNETNNVTLTVDGTKHNPDVGTITLHYCDSLNTSKWKYLTTIGFPYWEYTTNTMYDVNMSPHRYYKAQSP
jgi:hypothetical protein